jgi:hypothetical protein
MVGYRESRGELIKGVQTVRALSSANRECRRGMGGVTYYDFLYSCSVLVSYQAVKAGVVGGMTLLASKSLGGRVEYPFNP